MPLCICGRRQKSTLDSDEPPGCTDVVALIIFVLFWCGMVLIASFAVVNGDPYRLVYGSDSFGNTCGRSNRPKVPGLNMSGENLTQKPYLFALDIKNPTSSVWICVEKCPRVNIYNKYQLKNYTKDSGTNLCLYDFDFDSFDDDESELYAAGTNVGPCPVMPIYKSLPVLNRCVPTERSDLNDIYVKEVFIYLNNIDLLQQFLTDIISCYQEIVAMCFVAFLVSFSVIFCVRFIAAAVIYLMFAMVGIGSLIFTGLLWYLYADAVSTTSVAEISSNGSRILSLDVDNQEVLLIYAIISTIILVLLFLLISCCLWQNTTLVVELFRQTGRCLRSTPLLLIQPLWTFLALMALFLFWIFIVLMLATAANLDLVSLYSLRPQLPFKLYVVDFSASAPVKYFWWYHIVGLIWTSEFILACQQIIISGAVALWYFSKDKSQIRCLVWTSTKRLIMYHLGSVALGSLIISIVKIPRLILMYLQKILQNSENLVLKSILRCCTCFLWLVDRCLRYVHHNAYTIVAIEGQDFCPASKQAYEILASNALQMSTVNTIGDFVLFMGKCGVTVIVGFIAAIVFKSKEDLHFYAVPLFIVCLFTFFIAHCFFSVYEMVIDTLFLCYCENKRIIDEQVEIRAYDVPDGGSASAYSSGSSGGFFFADSSLKDFMNRVIVMDRKDPDAFIIGEEAIPLRS